MQEGVGQLLREARLALMNLVMEEGVQHLAGERHQRHPHRRAHRGGKVDGYWLRMGEGADPQTSVRSPENCAQLARRGE